jgi:hypothetical protein
LVILLTLTYNYTTENIFKSTRLLIKFQKHIEKINCKPSSNWGLLNIISLKLHFQQTHDFFLIRNTKKYRIILMVVFCLYVYKLKKFTTRCRSSIKKCKYDRVYRPNKLRGSSGQHGTALCSYMQLLEHPHKK